MIQVVIKKPGEDPEAASIDGSLESIQKVVGGYFEAHRFGKLTLYCNEEGHLKYMAPNILDDLDCHAGAVIVGPVLVMKGDHSLPPHAVDPVRRALRERAVLGPNS